MDIEANIECPYCGSPIKSTVVLCLKCGREVKMILDLRAENEQLTSDIEELRQQMSQENEQISQVLENQNQVLQNQNKITQKVKEVKREEKVRKVIDPEERRTFGNSNFPMGIFLTLYLIFSTIAITLSTTIDKCIVGLYLYQWIFFLLIPPTIFVGINYVTHFSIWFLALLGYFQGGIILYYYDKLPSGMQNFDVIGSFAYTDYIFAVYIFVVGALFTLLVPQAKFRELFGWSEINSYLTQTQTGLDKIDKLLITVATVAASLKTLNVV